MPTHFRIVMLALSFGGAAFLVCGVAVFLTIGAVRDVALIRAHTLDGRQPAAVVYYTPAAVEPIRTAARRE